MKLRKYFPNADNAAVPKHLDPAGLTTRKSAISSVRTNAQRVGRERRSRNAKRRQAERSGAFRRRGRIAGAARRCSRDAGAAGMFRTAMRRAPKIRADALAARLPAAGFRRGAARARSRGRTGGFCAGSRPLLIRHRVLQVSSGALCAGSGPL